MSHKILYTEQAEGVDLLRADIPQRWRMVVLPTGAGKTAVIQTAATLAAMEGCRVLVATPLQVIRSAIFAADAFAYRGEVVDTRGVEWSQITTTQALLHALTLRTWPFVGVVTQQLLAQARDHFPTHMKGWILVLDEGHHSGEAYEADDATNDATNDGTFLYRAAERVYERGGCVWSVTATPFRMDGRLVSRRDVASYTVRYSDLALQGILPRRVRVRTTMCPDATGRTLTDATLGMIAGAIWAEGRPTVLRIPPGGSAEPAAVTAERMVAALIAVGYTAERILNVVGSDGDLSTRLQDELDGERERAATIGYAGRRYDVILACGRMREGADWPYCSHVVLVGLPTSLGAAIQWAGRGSRNKHRIAGYPESWRDDVLVSGYVPGHLDALEVDDQAKRALILAAAIECDEVVLDYRRFWQDLVKGFRLPPVERVGHPGAFLDRLAGTVVEQAVANATVIAARQDCLDVLGRDPTPTELWDKLNRWGGSSDRGLRRSLLAQAVVQQCADPELREAFGAQYALALEAATLPTSPTWEEQFEDTLADAFLRLAQSFPHLSTAPTGTHRGLSVEASLDPTTLRTASRALADERNAALAYSDEEIVRALHDPKSFPRGGQEAPLSSYFGRRTFASDLDRHLRRGEFDLDRLRLCVLWAHRGVCEHPVVGRPLDPAVVREALVRFRKSRRGAFQKLPDVARSARDAERAVDGKKTYTMVVAGKPESVIGLYWACQRGWRGLSPDVFPGLD